MFNLNVYPLLTLLWATFIVIAACTSDAHAFLYEQAIHFTLNTTPYYKDLLIVSDIHLKSEFYLIQKAGHMVAFGMMYFFLISWVRKVGIAFAVTGLFAVFSEVLQLYFNRNGRLFDIGVDMTGILFAYLVCSVYTQKFKVWIGS